MSDASSTAPSLIRILVTLLLPPFATHMFCPSKATPSEGTARQGIAPPVVRVPH